MTRILAAFAALLLIGFAAINGTTTATGQTGDGWIQLFNGKNLDGWTPTNVAGNPDHFGDGSVAELQLGTQGALVAPIAPRRRFAHDRDLR
jgi:hypothetical protein